MTDTQLEDIKAFLKNSVLRDLPPEEVDKLAETVQIRVAQPKEIIFKEGDPPDAFYIIGSGQVRVFVRHKGRIGRDFSVRGPGGHFGEVALLTGETRTANVESLVETRLVVLSKEQFDAILRDHPDISRYFMREMRGWLLKDQEIIEEEADAVVRASRMSWFDFVLVIGVSILLAITFNFSNPNGIPLVPERPDAVPSISASAVMEDYQKAQVLIVDAMPNNFYQKRHIRGAINVPPALFDIMYLVSFAEEDKDKEIVVYGNTISRPYDLEIAGKLMLRGYKNVKVLDGGMQAWEAKGYPVEKKVAK